MRVKNAQNPNGINVPQTQAKRTASGKTRTTPLLGNPLEGRAKRTASTSKRDTDKRTRSKGKQSTPATSKLINGTTRGLFIRATMTEALRTQIASASRKAGTSVQTFVTDATLAFCKQGCPLPPDKKRQEITRRADGYFPPYVEARFGTDAKLHQKVGDAARKAGVAAHVIVREAAFVASKGAKRTSKRK